MSETVKSKKYSFSPFITRIDAPKKSDFDKYYFDIEYKDIYRKAGIDKDGEEFGVIETKAIVKKRDIFEYINSQADTVGVAAYMRALAVQGDSLDNYTTVIDKEKVNDYSELPETLADVMTAGDKAKEAFAKLDPALKGSHTTIEGFLNSLSKDTIDAYIKGKVEAVFPTKIQEAEGGKE